MEEIPLATGCLCGSCLQYTEVLWNGETGLLFFFLSFMHLSTQWKHFGTKNQAKTIWIQALTPGA